MKRLFITLTLMLVASLANAQSCPDDKHPHAIDLGLPSGTKWACCNVEATTPEGYGGYFAWGETEEKEKYNWTTYNHCDGSESTCHNLGSDIAGTSYDVANMQWGGSWVMPSQSQIQELINGCSYTWLTKNDVNGGLFTGPNGATIFLPKADIRWNGFLECFMSGGYYWSSTQNTLIYSAYRLNFDSWGASWGGSDYCGMGLTVRPVITGGSDNIVLLKSDINEGGVPSRIFDMQGRALKETLMKGIYIKNGRKQVLKTVFPHN